MPDPLIVIVFVAAGGAADATTRAMERATHDALGLEAHVDVHETGTVPSDLDVLVSEQRAHAAAVVELTWAEQGRQARLRVHVARSGRWISRTIGFVPSDADAERGRTIGFAVASMLPDTAEEPTPRAPAPSPPEASAVAPTPAPADHRQPVPAVMAPPAVAPQNPPASGAPDPTGPDRGANEPPRRAPIRRFALDVFGIGTDSLDSNAQSVGARAAGHWFFTRFGSLRMGLGVDGGSLDAARGNFLTAFVSAGVAFHPLSPAPGRPFGLSLRSEYLLASQSLTSFSSIGPSAPTRSRVVSGLDVAVDGRWLLTSTVDLLVGGGLEDFFARTDVKRTGSQSATLPRLRLFGETGLGVRF